MDVVSNSNWNAYFLSTDHCFQVSVGFEHDHITQIAKKLYRKFLMMRLHIWYSTQEKWDVISKSVSIISKKVSSNKHQSNKLILFKNGDFCYVLFLAAASFAILLWKFSWIDGLNYLHSEKKPVGSLVFFRELHNTL